MPEMNVTVRWPDGFVQQCYSPSLVMHDHLTVGETYTVADFRTRSTTALGEASERVRAKFGFACTSAAATAEEISEVSHRYRDSDLVEVVQMYPPLPSDNAGAAASGN